jgi:hypothetical protein
VSSTTADQSLDLSEAESDILLMIALGYRSRVISDYLKLNLRTVDVHRRNLCRKLGIAYPENLNDAIAFALFRGAMPVDVARGFDSTERPCHLPVMIDPGSESSPSFDIRQERAMALIRFGSRETISHHQLTQNQGA